ncbi:MAG: thioredoxin domain-containing protein, partial [Gammaproteobacteria bacterium]
ALELARRSGKPILLSIGYSACHWCHVMAHESFEDEGTAALMNELFVNIKVDREERPDIDKIYQTAQQLLNRRSGGWPLTMFLTHDDQIPFAGGTYFPKEARWGMPAFTTLLRYIADVYRDKLDEIRGQNTAVLEALQQLQPACNTSAVEFTSEPLLTARVELGEMFDNRHGGFGAAPKFPHPPMVERLLRHYAASVRVEHPDETALEAANFTLLCMARGGIYDHLGGGFARYSVDAQWMIPHFEKMLYDNGPLLALYSEAWQISGEELFMRVARETAAWSMRDMQSPEGGFYSSLDADSEGHEGKFYVWSRAEVQSILTEEEYRCVAPRYGLDQPSNFEGQWHLYLSASIEEIAAVQECSVENIEHSIESARVKLLAARTKRVWPGRDEKILTSWNALMIRGLAVAGRILQCDDFIASAERALNFIREHLWADGELLATYKDGRAHLNAYLDDYAYLIDAILTLLQARWRDEDLLFAIQLADTLLEDFEDSEHGGFFFTAHHHERLIQRLKNFSDDAIPAGNGIAAFALGRLGHLLGESRYLIAAERTLAAGWRSAQSQPTAHLSLLCALEETLRPAEVVIIRAEEPALTQWRLDAQKNYAPGRMVFAIPASAEHLPGALALRAAQSEPVAYVCQGGVCSAPITSILQLSGSQRFSLQD